MVVWTGAGEGRWAKVGTSSSGVPWVTQLASLTLRKPEREEVWGMGLLRWGPSPMAPVLCQHRWDLENRKAFTPGGLCSWHGLSCRTASEPLIGKKSKWGHFPICR